MTRACRTILASTCLLMPLIAAAQAPEDDEAPGHEHHEHHEHHQHGQEPKANAPARAGHEDHQGHESGEGGDEPTPSERKHVPPPPPATVMHDMSPEEMIDLMAMDDDAAFTLLMLEQLEWRDGSEAGPYWDAHTWFGNDYDKLWLRTDGEREDDEWEGRFEAAWDRVVSRWWNVQVGARHDFGLEESRTWIGVGLRGLAPQWLEVEAHLYVGEQGRTVARFEAETEWLLTQRWVLQPQIELEAYGKDDRENGIGSGVSELEAGLRLRYEIIREIAPYIGIVWEKSFGRTADLAREHGEDSSEVQAVLGVRAWF